jgi:hypothetical protein
MAALFFLSQAALDRWSDAGRIELDGDVMTLAGRGPGGPRYALEVALRFLQVVGADVDPHALVGKVKREARLRELGGEWLAGSVVLGEVAYEVEAGFLCDTGVRPGARALGGAAPLAGGGPGRGPADVSPPVDAGEELTRFLLENPS